MQVFHRLVTFPLRSEKLFISLVRILLLALDFTQPFHVSGQLIHTSITRCHQIGLLGRAIGYEAVCRPVVPSSDVMWEILVDGGKEAGGCLAHHCSCGKKGVFWGL
jgi:hypothetical protein